MRGLLGGVGTIEGDVAGVRFPADGRGIRAVVLPIEGHPRQPVRPERCIRSPACSVRRLTISLRLKSFVRRAKTLGFTGAAVIHPSHVAIVNKVFQPTAEQVAHYEGLIAALEEGHRRGDGAVKYKGAMVDMAMIGIARDAVAEAKRQKART